MVMTMMTMTVVVMSSMISCLVKLEPLADEPSILEFSSLSLCLQFWLKNEPVISKFVWFNYMIMFNYMIIYDAS